MERFDLNSTRLMADSAYGSAPGTGRSRDLTVFCTSGIETTAGKPEKLSSTSRREISGGNIKMVEGPHFQKKPISECTSDEELNTVMEHAKQHGDKELWWECLRRRCELKRQTTSEKGSPLEPEFYAVMFAYETLQAELRRRSNYRAIRTWKMVENKGVKAVLEKWAKNKQKGNAFKVLMDHEAYDLTAEYVVLKYKAEFSPDVVTAARQSLLDAGVSPEKLEPY